ncbi:proline dehydrogenase family protein, partial [Pantoea sp. SIMBA_133]
GWDGFGVVVQAYGKRSSFVLDWLYGLAEKYDRKFMVRLVKGAYWDAEIKRAQVMGLNGFPVFTRKACSDVSFLSCATKL